MKNYYFPENLLKELLENNCIKSDKVEKCKSIIQENIEKFAVIYWCPEDIDNIIVHRLDRIDVELSENDYFNILREFYYEQEIEEHTWDTLENIVSNYIEE